MGSNSLIQNEIIDYLRDVLDEYSPEELQYLTDAAISWYHEDVEESGIATNSLQVDAHRWKNYC